MDLLEDTVDLGGIAFPVRYLFGPRPDWVPTSDAFWKTEGFPAIDEALEDTDASATVDEHLYHARNTQPETRNSQLENGRIG